MDSDGQVRRWLGRVLGGLCGLLLAAVNRPTALVPPSALPGLLLYGLTIVITAGRAGERIAMAPRGRRAVTWLGALAGAGIAVVLAWEHDRTWTMTLTSSLIGGLIGGVIGRAGRVALRRGLLWGLGGAALGIAVGAGEAVARHTASLGESLKLLAVGALGFGFAAWIGAAMVIAFRRTADDEQGMRSGDEGKG